MTNRGGLTKFVRAVVCTGLARGLCVHIPPFEGREVSPLCPQGPLLASSRGTTSMGSVDVRRVLDRRKVVSTHILIGAHELYTSSWPHPLYACVRARGMGLRKSEKKIIIIIYQVIFLLSSTKKVSLRFES